jgi:Ca2+/Na+ antiporter
MNWAHVHLMLNHIPVIGTGSLILLLIVALLRRSNELTTVALIFTILLSLVTIPVYLSGEPAEEVVEDMSGISEQLIEEHEEQAEIAFIFVEVTGALALIALIARLYSNNLGQRLALLTLLVLIISGGLTAWTANLGGKIHHEEIRSGTSSQNVSSDGVNKENEDD